MENYGEIVIAKVLDRVGGEYYKFEALVGTGHYLGKKSCVGHRGNPDLIGKDIIVRLAGWMGEVESRNLDESIASHFITSTIPKGFWFYPSQDLVLYGIWENRMKLGHRGPPRIGYTSSFFNPGKMFGALYFAYERGRIIPYDLGNKREPIVDTYERGITPDVGNAILRYTKRMNRLRILDFPRVVLVDGNIDLERRILPEFEKHKLKYLKMEPHQ